MLKLFPCLPASAAPARKVSGSSNDWDRRLTIGRCAPMLQDMTVKVNRQCSDWDLVVEKTPFGVSAAMLFVAKSFAPPPASHRHQLRPNRGTWLRADPVDSHHRRPELGASGVTEPGGTDLCRLGLWLSDLAKHKSICQATDLLLSLFHCSSFPSPSRSIFLVTVAWLTASSRYLSHLAVSLPRLIGYHFRSVAKVHTGPLSVSGCPPLNQAAFC